MIRVGLVSTMARTEDIPRENRYRLAVERAGAEAVWLPWSRNPCDWTRWAEELHGFLFTGGGDMDPKYYGEAMDPRCGTPQPDRDEMELGLLREILRRNKPVLGICRGCQTMNVALGGTLLQNIPGHSDDPGRYTPSHPAKILPGTLLRSVLGTEKLLINSIHHQAIGRPATGLVINAVSPDGIPEGLERPGGPLYLAVQFHPEATAERDPRMQALFDLLVKEAKKEIHG